MLNQIQCCSYRFKNNLPKGAVHNVDVLLHSVGVLRHNGICTMDGKLRLREIIERT
jgi:hypothetical protein